LSTPQLLTIRVTQGEALRGVMNLELGYLPSIGAKFKKYSLEVR